MTYLDICLIGVGLAVDASCVCTSNGLLYKPSKRESLKLALVFAIFQGVMPCIGYAAVGFLPSCLFAYNHFLALILLSILGVKMIYESFHDKNNEVLLSDDKLISAKQLGGLALLIQGISTSIDALSIGLTMSSYSLEFVLIAISLIAGITFCMCFVAVRIGIRIGVILNTKAELIGGLVLILLGIKIFLAGAGI
ncbi:MAG: manganese efflux pump [Eubacteriales bacterium]